MPHKCTAAGQYRGVPRWMHPRPAESVPHIFCSGAAKTLAISRCMRVAVESRYFASLRTTILRRGSGVGDQRSRYDLEALTAIAMAASGKVAISWSANPFSKNKHRWSPFWLTATFRVLHLESLTEVAT